MASLPCDLCGEETAILINSDLRDGNTIAVGESCVVTYALSTAAALTSGMPAEYGEHYGSLFDAIAANDPRQMSQPAPAADVKRRGGKRAASAEDAQPAARHSDTSAYEPNGSPETLADLLAPPLFTDSELEQAARSGTTD